MKNYAIILASGTGSRSGLNIPKQFYMIENKTLLEYSIDAFEKNNFIDFIVVVSNPDFMEQTLSIVEKNSYKKVINILSGGKSRQESSSIGVFSINDTQANILIHDAVRPFISQRIINDCIAGLKNNSAVNVAIESTDTIIQVNENNFINLVPNRKYLRRCQTPQCFKLSLIKKAHELALKDKTYMPTDDCGMVLHYNLADIYVVNGDENNIKITYPTDLDIAEIILKNHNCD